MGHPILTYSIYTSMIKKAILKWLRKNLDSLDYGMACEPKGPVVRDSTESMTDKDVTHLYIFPATGGKILEFRKYDHKTDKLHVSRYIIKSEDELVEKISRIMTMENLQS